MLPCQGRSLPLPTEDYSLGKAEALCWQGSFIEIKKEKFKLMI